MTIFDAEKLQRFFSVFSSNDNVLIIINADPDAIASAMAVKRLLWRRVASVTIAHINIIKRPDNIAMINFLGATITHIDNIDKSRFTCVVFVDSQPDHHKHFSGFDPDVIIDHHPVTSSASQHTDIRPEYGATATIMTEYLRTAKVRPSVKLATALFHAIKTDTNNFERQTTIQDIRAFQFLYSHASIYLAQKIEHASMKLEFLKYFEHALENRFFINQSIFVNLGEISNPDVCVLIADFFIKVDAVKWSVVSGEHDGTLIMIFRNNGLEKDAGKVVKEAFSHIGSAGGHKSMARVEIPVSQLETRVDLKKDKALLEWMRTRMRALPWKKIPFHGQKRLRTKPVNLRK